MHEYRHADLWRSQGFSKGNVDRIIAELKQLNTWN
jgi:hypothetical protein